MAYVPKALVEKQIADGQLQAVLDDWSLPFIGYHLYYPGRGQISPAMMVVVDPVEPLSGPRSDHVQPSSHERACVTS
ncbi:hypothetical protein CFBP5506_14590 [Agrobacterium tumefaciens]|uniref:LysR substrate-binding domain-containing protein n=1 Tax=Agrobacterium tumefaciens TaxID=358 RepID=A0AAF0KBQ4_AGRTU|nr:MULTISPECIES: hypothetical protein [Agrobacterium]WGM62244.1 hypothetical protein CFBP5506_14590 [Agrobacterium tumefaciens]